MNSTTTTEAPKTEQAPPPAPAPATARATAAIVPHTDNDDSSRALNAFGSAANFGHAQRMARLLSFSTMVPKQYQGEEGIANCIIALELAARIGASVFMVMQNLDIIHGRPGWRAVFLIATVNASGRFTPLRFRWEGEKGTDSYGCRAYAKDREDGEPCQGALIDWKMVKAEGWLDKQGSKWKTMPEQMFMYRAAAFWTRAYAPELSLGMQTTEEVIDTIGEDVTDRPAQLRAPAASNGAPKTTEDLEAALRAQKPAAAPTPAQDAPAASTPSQETKTEAKPAQGHAAKPEAPPAKPPPNPRDPDACFFCKEKVGPDGVDHEDNEGVIHRKHRTCTAFGKGEG